MATRTLNKKDFKGSLAKMLNYYQGVLSAIATDNLRRAVKKSDKYGALNNGILKSELFYLKRDSCITQLKQEIIEYIKTIIMIESK
ncbi:hypothetical protein OIU80_11490 [Flavobacterium sp. LS1R47]|uniref:Uncharacterized protein n=1 Tax=Flavobacterium frigoritolerans TaxID=2987686 RepID=A0A9X3C8T0_9FLAO|nr:hypothetical protein [Flavobacterium frigoritolerans]MCV9932908.1 hypothetical protein [Flavobacterium frigoritolerans]